VLAGAGLFQFSRLKYHCLDKCRTPYGFIVQHWHGPQPSRSAFQLGFDHGLYCVGCCWAIMLLMFVVGTGNVGWMLALGAVMAVERTCPGAAISAARSAVRCSARRCSLPGSTWGADRAQRRRAR
jgi:predicted metal-binding membrane protein